MMRGLSVRACDLPSNSDSSKVRGRWGRADSRAELSTAILADLDSTWHDTIGAEFGLADYEELLAALAAGRTK